MDTMNLQLRVVPVQSVEQSIEQSGVVEFPRRKRGRPAGIKVDRVSKLRVLIRNGDLMAGQGFDESLFSAPTLARYVELGYVVQRARDETSYFLTLKGFNLA